MQYDFVIPADHFQFYLEDENCQADTSEIWSKQTSDAMLAVAPCLIAVGIGRYGGGVAVTVEVQSARPTDPFASWDQVVECSIDILSGHIVITSPEGNYTEAPRIIVPPGTYRALVYYGNLDSISDENQLYGEDHYRIVLWPDSSIESVILKR